jgi:uncharacterized protein
VQLPLFPLHLVLFPGRPLPLHLFEDRYRRMLSDVLDGDRRFGVVAIQRGREVGGAPEVFGVGTVAEVRDVTELPDGRFNIVTRGTERFRVRALLGGAPYLRADVELLPESSGACTTRAAQVYRQLVPYLAALGAPEELLACLPKDANQLVYLAASALQVDLAEQQALLELDSTTERLDATLDLLRREAGLLRHLGTVGSLRPPGPGGVELN